MLKTIKTALAASLLLILILQIPYFKNNAIDFTENSIYFQSFLHIVFEDKRPINVTK